MECVVRWSLVFWKFDLVSASVVGAAVACSFNCAVGYGRYDRTGFRALGCENSEELLLLLSPCAQLHANSGLQRADACERLLELGARCRQASYTCGGSTNRWRRGRWVRKEIAPIAPNVSGNVVLERASLLCSMWLASEGSLRLFVFCAVRGVRDSALFMSMEFGVHLLALFDLELVSRLCLLPGGYGVLPSAFSASA